MNDRNRIQWCRGTLSAAVLIGALSGAALRVEADPLRAAAEAVLAGAGERGLWHNPIMPNAGADAPQRPADTLLDEEVRRYTREMLDRGGWYNAHAPSRRYEGGNALLAVLPGRGVTRSE